jgi:hypothetical protein
LPGATHYSFYDRPELVAKMADSFFQESRDAVRRDSRIDDTSELMISSSGR